MSKISFYITGLLLRFRYQTVLVILVAYSLILRVGSLQPGYFAVDVQRDYLLANHLIQYGEAPDSGPRNSVFGSQTVGPVYYYFVASFLLINNNILFLHLINILFQMGVLVFLYVCAEKMFSPQTAVLTALFFSFSHVILRESTFFDQAFAAGFFIYLSCILLLFSYTKKNLIFLLAGTYAYFVGAILHSSPLALLPVITIIVLLIIKKNSAKIWQYIVVVVPVLTIFLMSYWSLFTARTSSRILKIFVKTPHDFFSNLWTNLIYFFGAFFNFVNSIGVDISHNRPFSLIPQPMTEINTLGVLSILVVISIAIIYFVSGSVSLSRKVYAALIIGTIFVYILIMSFLNMSEVGFYHFVPIYGLFLIFLSECITKVFDKNNVKIVMKSFVVILLTQVFAFRSEYFVPQVTAFDNSIQAPIESIESKISEIKKIDGINNYNFFDLKEYIHWPNAEAFVIRPYFWTKLELDFNSKFVEPDPVEYSGFTSINDNMYIFLICPPDFIAKCQAFFSQKYPQHRLVENIYNDYNFSIYLAERHA